MSDELPWLKMLVLIGMLTAMFVGPLLAMKVHDRWVGRSGPERPPGEP